MGYRLEVVTKSVFKGKQKGEYPINCWCGGKLYGYLDNNNEYELESFKYLLKLGKFRKFKKEILSSYKIKKEDWFKYLIWFDGFYYTMELTHKQFLEFVKFYKKDLDKYYKYDINNINAMFDDLNEFCKNKEKKVIEWS